MPFTAATVFERHSTGSGAVIDSAVRLAYIGVLPRRAKLIRGGKPAACRTEPTADRSHLIPNGNSRPLKFRLPNQISCAPLNLCRRICRTCRLRCRFPHRLRLRPSHISRLGANIRLGESQVCHLHTNRCMFRCLRPSLLCLRPSFFLRRRFRPSLLRRLRAGLRDPRPRFRRFGRRRPRLLRGLRPRPRRLSPISLLDCLCPGLLCDCPGPLCLCPSPHLHRGRLCRLRDRFRRLLRSLRRLRPSCGRILRLGLIWRRFFGDFAAASVVMLGSFLLPGILRDDYPGRSPRFQRQIPASPCPFDCSTAGSGR